MSQYAPIAIFVYRRPDHTRRMLDSLAGNPEFSKSQIYVFSDGPKTPEAEKAVGETREIIRSVRHGNISIMENKSNQGLACSISSGVSEICEKHGKIIVIEDDLVVSRYFLEYMNAALCKYEGAEKVMHVTGYMYPVSDKLPETFFFRNSSSWGWGTWKRAWKYYDADAGRLLDSIRKIKNGEYDFNICNSCNYTGMLDDKRRGRIDSWAIAWDASIFINSGLCLYPSSSLVRNIGFDGTGRHCGFDSRFESKIFDAPVTSFSNDIRESEDALKAIVNFYRNTRKPLLRRISDRIRSLVK